MRRLLCLTALFCGCGYLPASQPPRVVAHRSGAGNWPENSRTAVLGAVERHYPGIEFDLVLTRDGIPVLAHDYWLAPERCTYADGSPLPAEDILIRDLFLAELQTGYRCGGLADPLTPDARVLAEPAMTLDELLAAVKDSPQMMLVFDIKYLEGKTLPAQAYADAVMDRVRAAGLWNPYAITTTEAQAVSAFRQKGRDVPVTLVWPKFGRGESDVTKALSSEVLSQWGLEEPIALARATGATGLNVPFQVVDRTMVEQAQTEGLQVFVWTPNTQAQLAAYCRWPVDAIITDFPERAPCL